MQEEVKKQAGRPPAAKQEDVEELKDRITLLEVRLDSLTNAIRQSAHVMGWPRDLLERQGISAFDKTKEKLEVNGR